MLILGPDKPFPPQMKGRYCEVSTADSRYVKCLVVSFESCSSDTINKLRDRCLFGSSNVRKQMIALGMKPSKSSFWIYSLMTYVVTKEILQWGDEADGREVSYETFLFSNFDELISFIKRNYNIEMQDFKKDPEGRYIY